MVTNYTEWLRQNYGMGINEFYTLHPDRQKRIEDAWEAYYRQQTTAPAPAPAPAPTDPGVVPPLAPVPWVAPTREDLPTVTPDQTVYNYPSSGGEFILSGNAATGPTPTGGSTGWGGVTGGTGQYDWTQGSPMSGATGGTGGTGDTGATAMSAQSAMAAPSATGQGQQGQAPTTHPQGHTLPEQAAQQAQENWHFAAPGPSQTSTTGGNNAVYDPQQAAAPQASAPQSQNAVYTPPAQQPSGGYDWTQASAPQQQASSSLTSAATNLFSGQTAPQQQTSLTNQPATYQEPTNGAYPSSTTGHPFFDPNSQYPGAMNSDLLTRNQTAMDVYADQNPAAYFYWNLGQQGLTGMDANSQAAQDMYRDAMAGYEAARINNFELKLPEYLRGINFKDLLAQMTYEQRGIQPQQFGGRNRWGMRAV